MQVARSAVIKTGYVFNNGVVTGLRHARSVIAAMTNSCQQKPLVAVRVFLYAGCPELALYAGCPELAQELAHEISQRCVLSLRDAGVGRSF